MTPVFDARLRNLIELLPGWYYWEQDKNLRFTVMTGAIFERFGIDPKPYLGKTRWELDMAPLGDGGRWDKHKATLRAHRPFTEFIFKYVSPSGALRFVSTSGQPVFDDDGQFNGYRGISRDVTRRVWRERRLVIEQGVARILADASSTADAASQIIRTTCEALEWTCGARWECDDQNQTIRCTETWSADAPGVDAFLAASRRISPLAINGDGLVRRTCASGKPQWIRSVTDDKSFLRAPEATNAGLRSAFAFPIRSGTKTIGAMEFYSKEAVHQADDELLISAAYIGSAIGQFCERKRAEEELVRFRTAMNMSGDPIYLIDRATLRYLDFNDTACRITGYSREELLKMGPLDMEPSTDRAELERRYDETIAHPDRVFTNEFRVRSRRTGLGIIEAHRRAIRMGDRWMIVSVARNITKRKLAERAILRSSRMYAALSATNEAIMHARSLEELYQRVCDAAVGGGKFLTTAVLIPVPDTPWVRVAAVAGSGIQRMREARISIDGETAEGRGLVGTAFRTHAPCVCNAFLEDERTRPWHEVAREIGVTAGAAVPLRHGDRVLGALLFHSNEEDAFDDDIVKLLERMAENISFALDNFEREAERQSAEQALRESEARFRSLTDLSSDWFWEQDAQFRFTKFEGKKIAEGRVDLGVAAIGRRPWELPGIDAESFEWEQMREIHLQHQPFRDFEYTYRVRNGKRFHIAVNGEPVFDNTGEFLGYRGTSRDITAQKREEALLALEHAITRQLAQADSPSTALQGAIRLICETEDWDCGEYWSLDESAMVLRYGGGWHAADPAIEEFHDRSRTMTFRRGVGFPGLVWDSGEPLWIADISADPRVLYKQIVTAAGIHSAILFPVTLEGKLIGVLDFVSRVVRTEEPRFAQAMRVVGSQLGQFLHRKQAEKILRESEARFRALTNLSSDWYWEQDAEFRFVRVDSRREDITSAQEYLKGKLPWETSFQIDVPGGWPEHRKLLETRKSYRDIVMYLRLPDGSKRYISVSGEPVFDNDGQFAGYRGVTREVTAQKLAEERIQYLATHDGLTDLPNRFMFTQLLALEIESAKRYKRKFAVFFIDLDRFKIINDTLGHAAGDTMLKEMSVRLKDCLRTSDVVARFGGDEFVVLLQEVNEPQQVMAVARKLLSSIIKPLSIAGQECRVTGSIGICMYPGDGDDEETLMKNADIAMYLAKEEGKNNFQFYARNMKAQSLERLTLETRLRRALEQNEFSLNYQAKVDLKTGEIAGVEALLRWHTPDLGSISPAQFIPIAEETGLIVAIGRWVLRTACAQNVAWQHQGLLPVCMAVNLSARQFNDENLLSDIKNAIEESGMAPEQLELEITEGMVMQNAERATRVLSAIKGLGVRLAIDDFGTGYSSLAQIKRYPIDTLKVDRSFIRDIPQDAEDKAITEAIIAMGRTLHLTIVAEGVETREQVQFLRDHDCDQMQGYYFSKPVVADEFAKLLSRQARLAES